MRPSSPGASAVASSKSSAGTELTDSQDPRRELLLGLMQAGLAAVDGRRRVAEALRAAHPATPPAPVWVAAVGKAAFAMAQGAHEVLGDAIQRTLIITRDVQPVAGLPQDGRVEVLYGAHPMPDERSLAAGARLLEWVAGLPADTEPLFLISGGASSLVEVLAPG